MSLAVPLGKAMQRRIYLHNLSGWWQNLDLATGIGGRLFLEDVLVQKVKGFPVGLSRFIGENADASMVDILYGVSE